MLRESFDKERDNLLNTEKKLRSMGYIMLIMVVFGIMITLVIDGRIGLIMFSSSSSLYILTVAARLVIGSQISTIEFIIENNDCECANKVVIEKEEE